MSLVLCFSLPQGFGELRQFRSRDTATSGVVIDPHRDLQRWTRMLLILDSIIMHTNARHYKPCPLHHENQSCLPSFSRATWEGLGMRLSSQIIAWDNLQVAQCWLTTIFGTDWWVTAQIDCLSMFFTASDQQGRIESSFLLPFTFARIAIRWQHCVSVPWPLSAKALFPL